MPKFVLKNIESVKGKQKFKELVILDDSKNVDKVQAEIDINEKQGKEVTIKGQLDIYRDSLEKKYKNSMTRIYAIMNRVAELQSVSPDKFKDVTPGSEIVKEYEFKYGDLRVYAIKIPDGKLIILGGYKNQQKSDFIRFRALKKQFLASH